jgi:PPOX class probable F420-dependent enzyme
MKDGSPQATPVWFNWDGQDILINSAAGRLKDRNMRARPWVAVCVMDPQDSGRYIQVRGKVVEITSEGAEEHINQLSLKYTGNPVYQWYEAGMVRVIYRIRPEHVSVSG